MQRIGLLIFLLLLVTANWGYAEPYTDNGDGTVTDEGSGLVWQQDVAAVQPNWQGALDYCNALTLAGFNDWRLPDIKQLRSLVDDISGMDSNFSLAANPCWSSTSASSRTYAWRMSNEGFTHYSLKTSSGWNVRCVR